MTVYFFNLAVGHDPQGLKIAVVNKEMQQKHVKVCEPKYYNGCFLYSSEDQIMSCAYIKSIQSKSIIIVSIR